MNLAQLPALVFDTTCLSHFARADRLDDLRDLVVAHTCFTTGVVLAELHQGAVAYPALTGALALDWVEVLPLDTLPEIKCFVKWTRLVGSGDRDAGEASVFVAAELRGATAVCDDRDAVRVARQYGVEVHGTLWLLAEAYRLGKLTVAGVGSLIDTLRATGHRLPCTGAEFPAFARRHGLL